MFPDSNIAKWAANEPTNNDCAVLDADNLWRAQPCDNLFYGYCKYSHLQYPQGRHRHKISVGDNLRNPVPVLCLLKDQRSSVPGLGG